MLVMLLDGGLKLVFLLSSWQTNRKARRKDRDGDQTVPDTKPPYLDENVLERKLPDADLRTMVDLPAGLDYNEWLASHSEYNTYYGDSNQTGLMDRRKQRGFSRVYWG